MDYQYAIEVLQKAAFEIAGEIMTNEAIRNDIEKDQISQTAYQLLFGNALQEMSGEKVDKFFQLIKAIRILKEANAG